MGYLLGIDVGTSATKVLLCDERGDVVGTASSPHALLQPHPGWSEQEPRGWWDATVHSIRNVLTSSQVRAEWIRGIGLSGQMHGSVFLSREALAGTGKAVQAMRPALLWNDQRTGAQCEAIERAVGGRAELVRQVGNAALTGFTAPKILWLRENEPENYAKVAGICLPKDFIALKLTGTFGTDVGDASGTLLLDVTARNWHRGVCEKLGIDTGLLPPVRESAYVVGKVTKWAAEQTGLPEGTPVVAGSGDNMTSAVGSGVVGAGDPRRGAGDERRDHRACGPARHGCGRGALGTGLHPPAPSRREGEQEVGRTHTPVLGVRSVVHHGMHAERRRVAQVGAGHALHGRGL